MPGRQRWDEAIRRGMATNALLLYVYPAVQHLDVFDADGLVTRWPVSTSARGLGEMQHSYRTPRGWHAVAKVFGVDAPLGAMFRSRRLTGQVIPPADWKSEQKDDLTLTRLLWLRGLEPSFNTGHRAIDSLWRMIYVHGTNHEQYLGVRPSSAGCIRMGNQAVADLVAMGHGRPMWVYVESESEA